MVLDARRSIGHEKIIAAPVAGAHIAVPTIGGDTLIIPILIGAGSLIIGAFLAICWYNMARYLNWATAGLMLQPATSGGATASPAAGPWTLK